MSETVTITLPAHVVPTLRQVVDDTRVWAERQAFDARSNEAHSRNYDLATHCSMAIRALDAATAAPVKEAA